METIQIPDVILYLYTAIIERILNRLFQKFICQTVQFTFLTLPHTQHGIIYYLTDCTSGENSKGTLPTSERIQPLLKPCVYSNRQKRHGDFFKDIT